MRSVERQVDDPDSLLSLYRRLLTLRSETPALEVGDYLPVTTGPEAVFLFQRRHEGERMQVALNFSDDSQRVRLPSGVRNVPIRLSTEGVVVEYPSTV